MIKLERLLDKLAKRKNIKMNAKFAPGIKVVIIWKMKNLILLFTLNYFSFYGNAQMASDNWYSIKAFLPLWKGATIELLVNDSDGSSLKEWS